MKKQPMTVLGLMVGVAVMFGTMLSAHAATYQYVNGSGEIKTVTADNATSALEMAPERAPRSGVMLVTSSNDALPSNGGAGMTYGYVNMSGVIVEITAVSANDALLKATDRAPRSGVILINNESNEELVGEEVAVN